MSATEAAPKVWRGRFYEDFEVGDVFRSRLGRTVTQTDNIWFTCLTMNTNQMHFNVPYTEGTRFGQPLVNSAFTLALVTGMTVPDTSENATANLAWTDIKLPKPVYEGDTLDEFRARSGQLIVDDVDNEKVTGNFELDFDALEYGDDPALVGGRFFLSLGRGAPPRHTSCRC